MKQDDARKILQQGLNVLLTGAAGSGKTFLMESFAQWARDNKKKVSVTATTGLAATNINGTTIHNWSGIGVRNQNVLANNVTISNIVKNMLPRYRKAIEKSDILIIDEISMLHSFQLDAVDQIVRGIRENQNPFGGVQVILCGDFFQLPPITEKGEQMKFITESIAYNNGNFRVCYLEEYYRHIKDDNLTKILNAIRQNNFNNGHWDILNSRINAPVKASTVTKICTSNKQAEDINEKHLKNLPDDSRVYQQQTDGNGDSMQELLKICKNKVVPKLHLKRGAIVMFNKNDPQGKYFNGSLGIVTSFDDDGWPNVQLNERIEDGQNVPGKMLKSIKITEFYIEDENGQRLSTIRQLPLKLAWAITVHKSQGMTLDAARIDLSNTFVEGLGYVALSRVRSIKDLSITGINNKAIRVNPIALNLEKGLQELSEQAFNSITVESEYSNSSTRNTQFLTTQGINYRLDELIKNAKKNITLISPYIKLNLRLKELLKEKKHAGLNIIFICKGDNLYDQLSEYSTSIRIKNNLHAKCYLSEESAIVTSLNLYTFSQINNEEMGIYIKNIDNNPLYIDIKKEVERLLFNSRSM